MTARQARRHWAVLVLLAVVFLILTPDVARLGFHGDDHCFVYASTHHNLSYFVRGHLQAAGRPFLAFSVYYLAILFSMQITLAAGRF